jgi:hypothetical protein
MRIDIVLYVKCIVDVFFVFSMSLLAAHSCLNRWKVHALSLIYDSDTLFYDYDTLLMRCAVVVEMITVTSTMRDHTEIVYSLIQ